MIRAMRWSLIVGLLIGVIWKQGWWQRTDLAPKTIADWRARRVNDATLSAVDLLDSTQWIVYILPPGQPLVRVVTNATVPQSFVTATPTDEWQYTLHYQVLSRTGTILLDHEYLHRTGLTTYVDDQTKEVFTGRFYLSGSQFPADGKVMVLNLQGLPEEATQLRLRLAAAPAPLLGAVTRVYCRESATVKKLRGTWQRLSAEHKEVLARGNLYPADLLSDDEKRNVLRQRWSSLAPEGVPGVDYFRQDLYALKDIEEEDESRDRMLPAGSYISPTSYGMLMISEAGGSLRLMFAQVPWATDKPTDRTVQLRWYGRGPAQRRTYTMQWNDDGNTLPEAIPGGLLEVIPRQELILRVFLTAAGKEQEITPDPVAARMYRVDVAAPVEYDIFHERQQPTPFRLSLRSSVGSLDGETVQQEKPVSLLPATVQYELLDATNAVVQQGTLQSSTTPSVYDRILTTPEGIQATELTHYYFSLPPAVVRVRLRAQQGVALIAAANRPTTLTREVQIPEEFYAFADSSAQPGWFPLWPENAEQFLLNNRVLFVVVQPRPPETDPEILAGRYQWEDYQPAKDWRARQLLTPAESAAPRRPQTLPVLFNEIPVGREYVVNFATPPGRAELTPTLLYVQPQRTSQPERHRALQVRVNGQVRREVLVTGSVNEIQLPSLTSGAHRVTVIGPGDGRAFLNYRPVEDASPAFLVRTALRFDGTLLSFDYEKRTGEDEMLSLRLYTPHQVTTRTRLRVRISGPSDRRVGPYLHWTFRDRLYDIRPASGEPVAVLGTDAEVVTPGQFLALPLGDDVPPGVYRIQMELEQGPGGYLILSKITPGVTEQRSVVLERGEKKRPPAIVSMQ